MIKCRCTAGKRYPRPAKRMEQKRRLSFCGKLYADPLLSRLL